MNPFKFLDELFIPKTRVLALFVGEDFVIQLASFSLSATASVWKKMTVLRSNSCSFVFLRKRAQNLVDRGDA